MRFIRVALRACIPCPRLPAASTFFCPRLPATPCRPHRLMSTSPRLLVIRADDAGSAPGANRAIRDALRAGTITAVGFMAVAPAFAEAAEMLRGELAHADVGVHATVNAEWDRVRWGPLSPLSEVSSLVDAQGHFLPNPHALAGKFSLPEMLLEVRRQVDAVRAAGVSPSYLDTHMGFDRLPGVGDALRVLAAEQGLRFTAREPAYVPFREPGENGASWLEGMRPLPSGTYQLITHPGSDTPDFHAFSHAGLLPGQIARERAAETRALCSPAFRAGLTEVGFKLVRFSSLP